MPLSYGIPLGILIMLLGAFLSIVSKRNKKLARLVMIAGGAVTFLTILMIILAANSGM